MTKNIPGRKSTYLKTYRIIIDGVDTGSVIAGRTYEHVLKAVHRCSALPEYQNRITIAEFDIYA